MSFLKLFSLKSQSGHMLVPLLWVLGFEIVSSAIGFMTQPGVDGWFAQAQKPSFMPPNIVFPAVWSTLYILIALAGWRLWRARSTDRMSSVYFFLFCVYMLLNWSWSFVFFTHAMILTGCGIIFAMNLISAILIISHLRRDMLVSLLLLPPLAWTAFALLLNAAFLQPLQQVM